MSEKLLENLKLHGNLGENLSASIFEQIVENFPDIIHSVNQQGVIVSTNKAAEDLLGYSKAELLGKSVFDIYPEEISKSVKAGFQQLKSEGFQANIESKLLTKNGEVIDVEIRSISLYDYNGQFSRTFSIIRDMRELNALKGQLIQSSKLAAVGELAAGIMHNIRNPLTVISNYNNKFLKDAIDKSDFQLLRKCQTSIEKAASRIQRLSDHLHSYSRNEVEPPSLVDLSLFIDDCIMMVESKIKGADITLDNRIKGRDLKVLLSPNLMEQVIVNLISNACDAMETSATRNLSLDAEFDAENLTIGISDTGQGISKENLEHIFESFYTTKPKGKGTGLGLSIAQSIVEDQGGTIAVESEVGKGTTFRITLPKDKS
jgi:PAS domain S-box-containing protein